MYRSNGALINIICKMTQCVQARSIDVLEMIPLFRCKINEIAYDPRIELSIFVVKEMNPHVRWISFSVRIYLWYETTPNMKCIKEYKSFQTPKIITKEHKKKVWGLIYSPFYQSADRSYNYNLQH